MATEQWEIDLRRQLGKELQKQEVTSVQANPKTQTSNFLSESMIMMFLLITLGITLLFAYDFKTGGHIQALLFSYFEKNIPEQNELPLEIEKAPQKSDNQIEAIVSLREDIQKNKVALDSLSAQLRANEEKISLMGIIFNENFLVLRSNMSKDNLIFFNRDWTIDKMPKNILLTEEDKAYLNKFIKPQ